MTHEFGTCEDCGVPETLLVPRHNRTYSVWICKACDAFYADYVVPITERTYASFCEQYNRLESDRRAVLAEYDTAMTRYEIAARNAKRDVSLRQHCEYQAQLGAVLAEVQTLKRREQGLISAIWQLRIEFQAEAARMDRERSAAQVSACGVRAAADFSRREQPDDRAISRI